VKSNLSAAGAPVGSYRVVYVVEEDLITVSRVERVPT
jgi:hypothetical protein